MKCIILAGGSGERLWPISRDLYPKSLLNLYGKNTLIQNIYRLSQNITKDKNIITITNIRQKEDTELQLKSLYKNPVVIAEPMSKNTAPAIASAIIYAKNKQDEIVIVLPVDFEVKDEKIFIQTIKEAEDLAKKGFIAAIGIKPNYEEKGFGYLEVDKTNDKVKKVISFVEKPDEKTAKEFVKNENYYWNTGIYVAKMSVFTEAYKKYANDITAVLSKDMFDENGIIKYEYYDDIPEISIDYAIMEKTDNLAFVELKTEWKDYGSWHAIHNNSQKDSKNNVIRGNVIAEDTKNSFICSSKELVAVSGLRNTVVIETEDAVLVCDESRASDINKLVKKLKGKKDITTQERKTVFRPWGFYTCLNKGEGWLTKIITVSPGHKLSLQSHNHRSEHWVVLDGTATVILEDKTYTLSKRRSIDIPVLTKHSLQNKGKEPLKILEVQKGDYIGEDDIVRYEDDYGRVK